MWVCAEERAIITYCEGDIDVTIDPDAATFRARLARAAAFYRAPAPALPPTGPARFPLGRVVLTPGARDLLAGAGRDPRPFLDRHAAGDWGDVPPEDARANERSIADGSRIVSSYALGGADLWIITEADRSSTCLLLREEY